jgi:glutathione peroxidase
MSDYKGKVLLIVNTAIECGFTPQYEDLQVLYEKYHDNGFDILDFPCNQFGNQAPGNADEIESFCTSHYGTAFPRFAKTDVIGENASPLFRYLTENTKFEGFDLDHKFGALLNQMLSEADPDYKNKPDIKWNFTKFLIDRSGNIVKRYESTQDISAIDAEIPEIL